MTAVFMACSLESFNYLRGSLVINKPVNLSSVLYVEKSTFAWYPDNNGKPAIKFHFGQKEESLEWAYEDEKMRDSDFTKITTNQF